MWWTRYRRSLQTCKGRWRNMHSWRGTSWVWTCRIQMVGLWTPGWRYCSWHCNPWQAHGKRAPCKSFINNEFTRIYDFFSRKRMLLFTLTQFRAKNRRFVVKENSWNHVMNYSQFDFFLSWRSHVSSTNTMHRLGLVEKYLNFTFILKDTLK